MRQFRAFVALVLVASAAATVLSGCGDSASADHIRKPTVVHVRLAEWSVSASRSSVPAGRPVTFTISNAGNLEHEMVLEPAGSDDKAIDLVGVGGQKFESEAESIHPGATLAVTWQLPGKGAYQLACHVPGHFQRGMVTRLSVT